jgi:hypothetical protein
VKQRLTGSIFPALIFHLKGIPSKGNKHQNEKENREVFGSRGQRHAHLII